MSTEIQIMPLFCLMPLLVPTWTPYNQTSPAFSEFLSSQHTNFPTAAQTPPRSGLRVSTTAGSCALHALPSGQWVAGSLAPHLKVSSGTPQHACHVSWPQLLQSFPTAPRSHLFHYVHWPALILHQTLRPGGIAVLSTNWYFPGEHLKSVSSAVTDSRNQVI